LITRDVQVEHSFRPIEGDLKPTMTFGVLEFREFSFIRLKPYHGKIAESPPTPPINPPSSPDINEGKRIIGKRVKRP